MKRILRPKELFSGPEACLSYLERHNYKSFDLYDGLLSPLAILAFTNSLRRVLIQLIKRLPPNSRKLLRIPKTQMAVTLANALEASVVYNGIGSNVDSSPLAEEILRKQNVDGGWGYEFDASLRWGSYSKEMSNIIATYFCTKALTSAGIDGDWKIRAREYVTRLHNNKFFRYAESSSVLIHNANYLGAATLAYLGGKNNLISSALATSNTHQRPNGSWAYGNRSNLGWIDNFHTCYILIALLELEKYGFRNESVLEKGMHFWLKSLSVPSGLLYFSEDKVPTSDINTYSCSLQLVSEMSRMRLEQGEEYKKVVEYRTKLLTLLNQDRSSDFAFRWKVAPASLGLAYASRALEKR